MLTRGTRTKTIAARRVSILVVTSLVLTMAVVSPARAAGNSANAKACQKDGWKTLVTTTGAPFANQDACVSYGAKGGVLKRAQTISFTSTNPSPVTVGGTYTPTATATSGLPVSITVDPASSSICSLSGTDLSFDAAGTCTINANQAGDATYNAAAHVQQSVNVVRRSQTISFTSTNPSPVTVGGTYTPTATATSGLPVSITVDPASSSICSLSGTDLSFDAAGTCTINANQAGDATYDAAAQVQQSITVDSPVDTAQSVCASQGGTYGTATAPWSCKDLPSAVSNDWAPLQNRCAADGGVGFVMFPIPDAGWDTFCFASAVDALLLAVSGAVAGALYAALHAPPVP
jgi:hypothetical protein